MTETLLTAVSSFADVHAGPLGAASTPIPGLAAIRADHQGELQYAISRPLVALVVQGGKRVMMGRQIFDFGAGDTMVIAADVPTVSQITHANARTPYYALVFDLLPPVIEELCAEMGSVQAACGGPIRIAPTESEVTDTAGRLMSLLDRPVAAAVLQKQLVREMHYWLLAGHHGPTIRRLGVIDGAAQRIARAVAVIRSCYAQPLRIERLAEVAAMSQSTFHQHFRAVTSLSPLQFQKQFRLIEARRMMLSNGASASTAAYAVGYESVSQFTREYGRMFGTPPVRDMRVLQTRASAML